MTEHKDIEDVEVEKIEPHETQTQEQPTDETQTQEQEGPKVGWWIGSTSKITISLPSGPCNFEFPNTSTIQDLSSYAAILPEIIKDIVKQREDAAKAQEASEDKEEKE